MDAGTGGGVTVPVCTQLDKDSDTSPVCTVRFNTFICIETSHSVSFSLIIMRF